MNWTEKLKPRVEGVVRSIGRFPVTTLFLIGITLMDMWMIESNKTNLETWVTSFVVGAFVSALAQLLYERFLQSQTARYGLYAGSLALTLLYYFAIQRFGLTYLPLTVRTGILLGVIAMAFFWIPSYKTEIPFHRTYLAGLKALFISWLYSIVIALGTSALLFAIDRLLLPVKFEIYLHTWNLNFVLLEPLFFLSFIPRYAGKAEEAESETRQRLDAEEAVQAMSVPRSLEVLLTYIVMPLLAVYTGVLLLYFLKNVRTAFWMDPFLEPLMISYALTGMVVYLLVCNLDNKVAVLFRKVFPKVIVPIMGFQLFSSYMRMQGIGLTHGRYFVLLTVAAALVGGLVFSFLPKEKSGWLGVLFMAAGLIAAVPPVDGFSVARRYHVSNLEKVLKENGMMEGSVIQPKADLPKKDKKRIADDVSYLESVDGLSKVKGVNRPKFTGKSFEETFGFTRTAANIRDEEDINDDYGIEYPDNDPEYAMLIRRGSLSFDVSEFDFLIQLDDLYNGSDLFSKGEGEFTVDSKKYSLHAKTDQKKETVLSLQDENKDTLLSMELTPIYEEVLGRSDANEELTLEDATVEEENEKAKVRIVFDSVSYFNGSYSADFTLLIHIKK